MPSDVTAAADALAAGGIIVVLDDVSRENEADLVMAAEYASTQSLAFIINHTSGYICAPMTATRAEALGLPLMVSDNEDRHATAFTITTDAAQGITTGISARDRAITLRTLANPATTAADLTRPGHVLPLRAHPEGVLGRRGHTEASVELCQLAGVAPVAVICELVSPNGRHMLSGDDAVGFAREHSLPVVHIADIVNFRRQQVTLTGTSRLETCRGTFTASAFLDSLGHEHLVLTRGCIADNPDVLVRVHSECMTGDVVSSLHCDCGQQLDRSLDLIADHGDGVVIYLTGHEGRGIGLGQKLRAYQLQQTQGLDTVDANLAIGCEVDNREYTAAAAILKYLNTTSIRLLTNNPDKEDALTRLGIRITSVVPLQVPPTPYSSSYLEAKRRRLNHRIDSRETVATV